MTLQKDNPDKRAEAVEIAGFKSGTTAVDQRKYAVTVPEDKLLELQRKAKLVDELVDVLEDVSEFLNYAWRDIEMNDYSFTLLEDVIGKVQRQIAKAKEE